MYGKHFASMYTGSMVGAGSHVFAVMGYCIAHADPKTHTVEMNPIVLATIIGDSLERIEEAIHVLCSPDHKSRTPDEDGRRLVQEGPYLYRLVNHARYREMQRKDDRREYMRRLMESRRVKAALLAEKANGMITGANPSVSVSGSCPLSLEGGAGGGGPVVKDSLMTGFDEFWAVYPKRKAKQDAIKAWKQTAKVRPPLDRVIKAVKEQMESPDWKKEAGKYIPHPATWLRAGRWDDEAEMDNPALDNIRPEFKGEF